MTDGRTEKTARGTTIPCGSNGPRVKINFAFRDLKYVKGFPVWSRQLQHIREYFNSFVECVFFYYANISHFHLILFSYSLWSPYSYWAHAWKESISMCTLYITSVILYIYHIVVSMSWFTSSIKWNICLLVWKQLSCQCCFVNNEDGVLPINTVPMITSSNGNIFRVTGPLCGEFIGHRWIPLTKAIVAELRYFLWFVPEQMVE